MDDETRRLFAIDHVQWCREESGRLTESLAQFQNGTLSIGKRTTGGLMTQGTMTHIIYLQRNIRQLGDVIAAFEP